jgi:cytochrome b pre-mRNA-processing protein 3
MASPANNLFKRSRKKDASTAGALYLALLAQSREPIFYSRLGVADTIDGRFDLLALHAFLVFDALREAGAHTGEIGVKLANTIFSGLDQGLRELGVTDFGMGRRMRKMADAFYGRIQAYGAAANEAELALTVQRNLYRGDPTSTRAARAIAHYMCSARAQLRRETTALMAGQPDFGPLPDDW